MAMIREMKASQQQAAKLKQELEAKNKELQDKKAEISARDNQIESLQCDVATSHDAEQSLTQLTNQQKASQDQKIANLLAERQQAWEERTRTQREAAEAREAARRQEERAREAERQREEVSIQLASDLVNTLKRVGDLIELQKNEGKRARCDVPPKSEFSFSGCYLNPVPYEGQDIEGLSYLKDVKRSIRDRIAESNFVPLNSLTHDTRNSLHLQSIERVEMRDGRYLSMNAPVPTSIKSYLEIFHHLFLFGSYYLQV